MLLLLLTVDPWVVVAFVFAAIWLWILYCDADQEPASERCRGCQKMVGYHFCTMCSGSGKREIGKGKFVDCTHHFGLWSTVVCGLCQLAGR
jgi:hypothetical protein